MKTMIERVAMAICGVVEPSWSKLPADYRAEYLEAARNAVEAMLEPDSLVITRALGAEVRGGVWSSDYLVIWQAMIDAALGEK